MAEETNTMETEIQENVPDVVVENTDRKVGSLFGNVKWFSSKLGYGFLTVQSEGELKSRDIFCHHTGIVPVNSKFRTLIKGEYINFDVEEGPNGPQGINITGIGGGALMCDNNVSYTGGLPSHSGGRSGPPRGRVPGPFNGNPHQQYQQATQYQFATTTNHPSAPGQRQQSSGAYKRPRPGP